MTMFDKQKAKRLTFPRQFYQHIAKNEAFCCGFPGELAVRHERGKATRFRVGMSFLRVFGPQIPVKNLLSGFL